MTNTNKSRGNKWELVVAKWLQPFFNKSIITTRQGNRDLDNKKIDLMFSDGNTLPFHPQCKSSQSFLWTWLDELPKKGVIFWKRVEKVKARQKCVGKYVIMSLETFEEFMKSKS